MHVDRECGDYGKVYDEGFIETMKGAGNLYGDEEGFYISIGYISDREFYEVRCPVRVKSWDETDEIARRIIEFSTEEHGGFSETKVLWVEVRGSGKVMSFDIKKFYGVCDKIMHEKDVERKEAREREQYEKLKAKYGQ
jgi:hypothetical protein